MASPARILGVVLLTLGLASAQPAGTWLNAADFGASGSQFTTPATTTAGSEKVTVKDPGDFKVGQGVMVSRCNIRYQAKKLWGPKKIYEASKALKDEVELRGYDGSAGSWMVYLLDVAPAETPSFRWSEDLGRTWHPAVPISGDWQALSGGTEVRFAKDKLDWQAGYAVSFSARDQLVSRIEAIDGKVLTLKDKANRTAGDAVVRHCDDAALQAAVNQAIQDAKPLFIGPGYYRLANGVRVGKPMGLTIEGANPQAVTLDISEGEGSCLTLAGGSEVTVRNLTMVGNTGFDQSDQAGYLNLQGAGGVWGFYLKPCNAISAAGTERILVENCHARKMSMEAFVSGGPSRIVKPPGTSTLQTTYLRCSVENCGRNAFNDWNVGPENTSILQCRIVDVGGCSWEGASRFVRFIGNYVRNGGNVALGNIGPPNRDASFGDLGAGQHIIADNVFEGGGGYGGKNGSTAISSTFGATQVIIRNNLFVNWNSPAISVSGFCDDRHFPSANTLITGNLIDLTCVGGKPVSRFGIDVSADDVIIADNQVYTRGEPDPLVTGIRLHEPALRLSVHDNQVRGCGVGLATTRAASRVGAVIDATSFALPGWGGLPAVRAGSHGYRGWPLVWLTNGQVTGTSTIEAMDPESTHVKLTQPRETKAGETFEVYPPFGADWTIRDNTIVGCTNPVRLDSYGSETTAFTRNTIDRGGAAGAKVAVEVRGRFDLLGNTFAGFDEPGAVVLSLFPDRFGNAPRSRYRENHFERCTAVAAANGKAVWDPAVNTGNTFTECGTTP